jgi:hypothetical protein
MPLISLSFLDVYGVTLTYFPTVTFFQARVQLALQIRLVQPQIQPRREVAGPGDNLIKLFFSGPEG